MGVPTLDRGGNYLGWGWGCLPWMGWRGYLPWTGGAAYLGQEGRGTYLGLGEGAPTLDRGVTTLDGGYLPWTGGGGNYLELEGGGTYPGQVMPRVVRLLRLPAGGLSCCL